MYYKNWKRIEKETKLNTKKEIKLFLKHIKKESQFRLVKINKIYSNCFLYVYWFICTLLIFAGLFFSTVLISTKFNWDLVEILNLTKVQDLDEYIYFYLYISSYLVGYILLVILVASRNKFYSNANKIFIEKLNSYNPYIFFINNMNKYGIFNQVPKQSECYISEKNAMNIISSNEFIPIDMLAWKNIMSGEILNNAFKFSIYTWKIEHMQVEREEISPIIELFTRFFGHHKIELTNIEKSSKDFLIKTNNSDFDNKFFIYSSFENEEEEIFLIQEVMKIFNEDTIKKILFFDVNKIINKKFRLLIDHGKIYFTFENCKLSFLEFDFDINKKILKKSKRKLTKIISNDLKDFYKMIELIFVLPLF